MDDLTDEAVSDIILVNRILATCLPVSRDVGNVKNNHPKLLNSKNPQHPDAAIPN
jgi:hypothetical protein